jgi:ATP synthase protein I
MIAPLERHSDGERLGEAVRTRRERHARGEREGRRSIGQDLALAGVLGWTVVIPTLLGILAGRWLDRRFGSGIFWTLGLLVAGVCLGCTLAWQRLQRL